MIISCQAPQTPIKNEKTIVPRKNKIVRTKQFVKNTEAPKNQKAISKKLTKPDKPKIQTKPDQMSQEMNPLANGIKVIFKEIEEPVGRDQSQAQVEAFVLQKAKRLAVEEAGTYISSLQVVKQGQMTEEQVNALASGILLTEIVGTPKIRTENGVMFVKVKARIQVDTSVLARQVEALMKNKAMMSKLAKQQSRIKELESQISGLKQSDIKRLESINAQTLAIEKQRAEQRHFLEQQRLAARKAIQDAQIKQIQREKILNQELQKILKAQEEARKKEQEAITREQDRIKRARLENEAALQELARTAQIQQSSWKPLDQSLSAQQALEEARNLRKEIKIVVKSLDDQYQKNLYHLKTAFKKQIQFTHLNLPANPAPLEMFETTEEYQRRMAKHEEKVQKAKKKHALKIDLIFKEQELGEIQLQKEWLISKKEILSPFVRRLEMLQIKEFTIPEVPVNLKIKKPEADHSRFPMLIMCQNKSYQRYWKYSDRKIARNLWKTREYFQATGIYHLEASPDLHLQLTDCYVAHHGITEKQYFSLQKVLTFLEINEWHALESEIQKIVDQEKKIRFARFAAKNPSLFIEPITDMEFILIPGGCFEMGCGNWSRNCESNEKPVHRVCISSFYMARYEVTQSQWQKIMGENISHFSSCGKQCPVESVNWRDTVVFIERLNMKSDYQGFRLPTEAEWEYGCRSGGKNEHYCGGDKLNALGWYAGNSSIKTHPVGLKQPNGLGIYDMNGNVLEWCQDIYHENAYNYHELQNPVQIDSTLLNFRVLRGGAWNYGAKYCRASSRYRFETDYRHDSIGFRLVFSPPSQ